MIQGLKGNALPFYLPLGPFVSVQANFDAPWRIAAHLDKQWPEVLIVYIEVVMVHVDRLVACELEASLHFSALKRLRLFLRHAGEYNAIPYSPLLPELIGNIVLSLFVAELADRDLLSLGQRLHCSAKPLTDLSQHCR